MRYTYIMFHQMINFYSFRSARQHSLTVRRGRDRQVNTKVIVKIDLKGVGTFHLP